MTFARANPLGWGWLEEFHSAEANIIDLNQSRSLDGHAGGAYNPTAAIVINNQFEVDSTGAAGANVIGIIATGKGSQPGINTTGGAMSGPGIVGTGGGPDGEGLIGIGVGIGSGVIGTGGPTNGAGILGLGSGTGDGVVGAGGAGGGRGGLFTGVDTLEGVKATGGVASGLGAYCVGGAPDGHGIKGQGTGTGTGIQGTGGATSGVGGSFLGGALNGIGVRAEADGNGNAVNMVRATGAHFNMAPAAGDPGVMADGDVWAITNGAAINEIIACIDGNKHQVLDTWVHGTTDGAGAGVGTVVIDDDNNVSSLAIDAANDLIEVTFDRPFINDSYAVTITMENIAVRLFPVVIAHIGAPGSGFSFAVYDDNGVQMDPEIVAFSFGIVVKGYFA